ncbi:DUF4192 domain-containing protein [Nocardioides mesophilus]|uniref:DUF4192 domain-containing protein n=1 Tax=Nocardioides mesophilus TaxID=433659 RepID=A0A7G9RBP2_9ACTN|nr:DUF4192 domain-containing protein [Nocardioides mesophilus]QNN53017.1 DUF4192 domain-containing protein [Nocardioides mesophilus]
MTETTILRAKSPTDLLACVPMLLGFHPERSVVMLSTGPARVPIHARVDLPADAAADEEIEDLAEELAGVAYANGVLTVAVLLYTDDELLAHAVGTRLARHLGVARVELLTVVRADGARWFQHDEDGSLLPGHGTAYDLATHPFTVQALVRGRVVHPSRAALRDSLAPTHPETLEQVRREAAAHEDRLSAAARRPPGSPAPARLREHLVAEGRWVQRRVRRFVDDRESLSAADTGRLLTALRTIEIRDVAWAEITHESVDRHVDLWRDVVRHSPRELLAAPAALLAFAAWISGDGALAWCAVDRCHEADPGYSMAGLVTQTLAAAVPPRSWRPLDPGGLSLFAD